VCATESIVQASVFTLTISTPNRVYSQKFSFEVSGTRRPASDIPSQHQTEFVI